MQFGMLPEIQSEQFASDNYSGICPEAQDYLLKANYGSAIAYGDDDWTKLAAERFRELFETDCEVFFVFNGTAANGLALATLCQSYHSIICHESAHIETDECGAPEFFSNGAKLLLAQGDHGKLGVAEGIMIDVVKWKYELSKLQQHICTEKRSSPRCAVLSM